MNNPTLALISLALDASLMRQTAIAYNIANANTRDYQPITVNFAQQLGQKPFYQASDGSPSLDEQITLSIKNATHYRALIKGLNHQLALMRLAMQGGN